MKRVPDPRHRTTFDRQKVSNVSWQFGPGELEEESMVLIIKSWWRSSRGDQLPAMAAFVPPTLDPHLHPAASDSGSRLPWHSVDRRPPSAALVTARRRRRHASAAPATTASSMAAAAAADAPPPPSPPAALATPTGAKTFWIHPLSTEVATAALEAGFSTFVFDSPAEAALYRQLARFDALLLSPGGGGDGGVYRLDTDGGDGGGSGVEEGDASAVVASNRLGAHLRIDTPDQQGAAMGLAGREPLVVMDTTRRDTSKADAAASVSGESGGGGVPIQPWWIIPAENLLAAYAQTATALVAVAATPDDAATLLATLEVGVAGVVLRTSRPDDVAALAGLRDRSSGGGTEALAAATVTSIRNVGVGDRVCVDTASLLGADEGLLVGSASQALFLVLSEAAACAYVPSRPFRVNAGPVHSYVLTPGGRTRYLADLRAGDEVTVVDVAGRVRAATVGRVKIERRPLVLVGVELAGVFRSVLLQNAETVRLAAAFANHVAGGLGGEAWEAGVAVSALAVGDEVAVRSDDYARHVGMAIEETIIEA